MAEYSARANLVLSEKHKAVADKKGLNLSKFLRKKIEEEYPEEFE